MQTEKPASQELSIIRLKALLPLLQVSRPTVWRWVKEGIFPSPLHLGPCSIGWRYADVLAWIEQRAAGRAKA